MRSSQIGFVFQNFNLLPRMTALENVMMPLSYGTHDLSERECRDRAQAFLSDSDWVIASTTSQRGSRGRTATRGYRSALVNQCSLLIADEPTGNLDSKTGEEILGLFRQLNHEDGLTIVLVTHDPAVAAHADRVIRIRDGQVLMTITRARSLLVQGFPAIAPSSWVLLARVNRSLGPTMASTCRSRVARALAATCGSSPERLQQPFARSAATPCVRH